MNGLDKMFLMQWGTISSVLQAVSHLTYQRLARQRKIKQNQSQQPLVTKLKSEIEHERLSIL